MATHCCKGCWVTQYPAVVMEEEGHCHGPHVSTVSPPQQWPWAPPLSHCEPLEPRALSPTILLAVALRSLFSTGFLVALCAFGPSSSHSSCERHRWPLSQMSDWGAEGSQTAWSLRW